MGLNEIAAAVEKELSMRCNFEKLWLYLNDKLDLDAQLEVLKHLDNCEICFEAFYLMARDRDADLFAHYEPKYRLAG